MIHYLALSQAYYPNIARRIDKQSVLQRQIIKWAGRGVS